MNGTIAERLMRRPWLQSDHCLAWTWSLEILFLGLAVCVMVVQFVVALKMRNYALWLDTKEKVRQNEILDNRREKEMC